MYFVAPSHPQTPAIEALSQKYIKRYNIPPETFYYVTAYDAATLFCLKVLKKLPFYGHQSGALYIGRQALRDTLYNTMNFKGMSGTLTCDAFGDCAQPWFKVLRMDDPLGGINGLQSNVEFTYTSMGQEGKPRWLSEINRIHLWQDKSLAFKSSLGLGLLVGFMAVVAITGYLSLRYVRMADNAIAISTEIQRMVLEMGWRYGKGPPSAC